MAINTGGFQVGVMPQFSPVDTNLITQTPAALTNGILSSLQVQGTTEQLKAFKQHAKEIADTEQIRTKLLQAQADQEAIKRDQSAALNQSYLDDQLATHSLATAKAKNELQLQPLISKVNEAKANSDLSTIPALAENAVSTARLGAINANIGIGTAGDRQQTAQIQAAAEAGRVANEESLKNANLAAAALQSKYASDIAPDQQALIVSQLKDKLESVQTDKERKDALQDAEIAYKKAQAQEARAHGDYFDAGGRATTAVDPVAQIKKYHDIESSYMTEWNKINNSLVANPDGSGTKITLSQYESLTHDPDTGKVKNVFKLFGPNVSTKTIADAEALLKQRDLIADQVDELRNQSSQLFRNKVSAIKIPEVTTASTLPQGWSISK